jgi:hypothetical protein
MHIGGVDPETRSKVRLFNPRYDHWEEHFQADPESGKITGLTAIGRATIARLEMNSEIQILARRQWMRLGLFL